MSDARHDPTHVAAHLVDEMFPEVPVRQWVCSLPWRLRYAMGSPHQRDKITDYGVVKNT